MGTCVRNWLNTGKIQENLFLKRLFSPTSCYLLQNFPACKPTTKNMRPPSYIGCLFPGSQGYFLYASSTKKQHLITHFTHLPQQSCQQDAHKKTEYCRAEPYHKCSRFVFYKTGIQCFSVYFFRIVAKYISKIKI